VVGSKVKVKGEVEGRTCRSWLGERIRFWVLVGGFPGWGSWFLVWEFLAVGSGFERFEMLRLRDGRCRSAVWGFGSGFGLATLFNEALKGH